MIPFLVGAIVRIGASIYLPAMPLIGEELQIDKAMMGNTLTIYFIVFAAFTLVAGALSDAYGRRPVLLAGMLFFMLGSALCAISASYTALMAGRSVQAFGASMIPGTLMAMIRDACSDMRVVTLMGWLAVLGGLFLVAAPMIGGVLTHFIGWTANFWFLVLFTVAVFGVTFFKIPETHTRQIRTPLSIKGTLTLTATMLTSSSFILVMLPIIAFFALQGAFLASAPYIVMTGYGLDPVSFGASNSIIVAGLFSGRWIGARVCQKKGETRVYRYGTAASLIVTLLYILMGFGEVSGLLSFLLIVGIFAAVFGAMTPVGMKSSLTAFRSNSGAAAALQGATLLGASAGGSALVGWVMRRFHQLSAESAFAFVSALLCFIAAVAAFTSQPD